MRPHTTSLTRRLLPAIALAALVVGACGGDDDSEPADTGASETTVDPGSDSNDAGDSADSVTIAGFAFDPEETTVAAGTEVTFANEDGTAHTATADDKSFDTGSIAGGSSGTVTAPDAPGEYPYICTIHPSMMGTLIVE